MATKKVVTLSKVKQLIDLNENLTNFDITFTAKSVDNSDFYALVVDQKTLDSNTPLEFKVSKGAISGNIISDNNVYQNHFLCLKSDKPQQVVVIIDKKEIQPSPVVSETFIPEQNQNYIQTQNSMQNQNYMQPQNSMQNQNYMQKQHSMQNSNLKPPTRPSKTNWTPVFILILIGAGACAYYYFIYRKKNAKVKVVNDIITNPETAYQIPITSSLILPEFETSQKTTNSSRSLSTRLAELQD